MVFGDGDQRPATGLPRRMAMALQQASTFRRGEAVVGEGVGVAIHDTGVGGANDLLFGTGMVHES